MRQKNKFEVKVASCKEKEDMASRSQIDCQLIELNAPELRDVQICVLLYVCCLPLGLSVGALCVCVFSSCILFSSTILMVPVYLCTLLSTLLRKCEPGFICQCALLYLFI